MRDRWVLWPYGGPKIEIDSRNCLCPIVGSAKTRTPIWDCDVAQLPLRPRIRIFSPLMQYSVRAPHTLSLLTSSVTPTEQVSQLRIGWK
jgi:hypothetical protein